MSFWMVVNMDRRGALGIPRRRITLKESHVGGATWRGWAVVRLVGIAKGSAEKVLEFLDGSEHGEKKVLGYQFAAYIYMQRSARCN